MRKPNNPIDALFMLLEKYSEYVLDEDMGNIAKCPFCMYVGKESKSYSTWTASDYPLCVNGEFYELCSSKSKCEICADVFGGLFGFAYGSYQDQSDYFCNDARVGEVWFYEVLGSGKKRIHHAKELFRLEMVEYLKTILKGLKRERTKKW